ncbi:ATPase inhibitor A, mitochondrial-like [Watersipora subatra]|uniref:ATPase inhibitor A, mitochondrial-like n=1 Tax=Watersipora subatra TaxID=2589382 RepID=UPI00355C3AAC
MAMLKISRCFRSISMTTHAMRAMSTGQFGSGEGKGGGGGGSIRKAGGAFGELEAAREEEYFRKLQAQQLKALHNHVEDAVHHQQAEISRLTEELKRQQTKLDRLKKDMEETKDI